MSAIIDHPAPAPAGIEPAALATFRKTGDGNLVVKVERFGRITIELGDSPYYMEVSRARSTVGNRPFQVYAYVGFSGTAEETLEAKRENGGFTPGAMHVLTRNGQLRLLEGASTSKKDRHAATGHAAAAAEVQVSTAVTPQNNETASPSQETDHANDDKQPDHSPALESAADDGASVGAVVRTDATEPVTGGGDDGGNDE